MKTYNFTAKRKADGSVIVSERVDDPDDIGMEAMAASLGISLLGHHPRARGLSEADVEIEITPAPERVPDHVKFLN